MGGFGGLSGGFPFELGGGPTDTELAHADLVGALGKGLDGELVVKPGSLRDLWWQSVAVALEAAHATEERATLQAFGPLMLDALPAWEKLLGLPTGNLSTIERQTGVAAAIARVPDLSIAGLRAALQAIDPRFDVLTAGPLLAVGVMNGRAFEPFNADPPYSSGAQTRTATDWPNYSDAFVLLITVAILPNETPAQALNATTIPGAQAFLNDVLPAWDDFQFVNLVDGPSGQFFYMDAGPNLDSFLDITSLD